MPLSNVELCSAALVKLGAEGISSFGDGSAEADVAGTLYDIIRDGLLGTHPWSFATTHAEVVQSASPPLANFEYAFDLPVDFINALSAGDECRTRGAVYQVIGREVHSNYEELILTYIKRPDEDEFPTYFVSALVSRLAAEFCLPLTENASRSELFNQPDLRVLILSAEYDLAKKMVRNVKNIVERHPLTFDLIPDRSLQWASDQFTVKRKLILRDPTVISPVRSEAEYVIAFVIMLAKICSIDTRSA